MFSKREYSQSDSGAVKKAGLRPVEKLLLVVPLLALLGFSAWQFRGALRNFGGAQNAIAPINNGAPTGADNIATCTTPTAENPVFVQADTPEHFFAAPVGNIFGVIFSSDDRFLAITTLDSTGSKTVHRVALWDVNARRKLWEKNLGDGYPFCVLSPDGATVAVLKSKSYGGDKNLNSSVIAYDTKSGRKLFERLFKRNSLMFAMFQFSPDSQLLSLPSQPPQWINGKSGEIARTFKDAGDNSCVTFLGPTRHTILTTSGQFTPDNEAFHFFPPAPQPGANIKTAPTTIRVFDTKTNRLLATLLQKDAFWSELLPRPKAFFTATLAACDGKRFFDGKIQIYDMKTAVPRATISQTSTNCVFSNDNALALLIAPRFAEKPQYSASTLMLHDVAKKRVLWKRELPFPQYEVAFLPDGKRGAITFTTPNKTPMGTYRALEIFSLRDGKTRRIINLGSGSSVMTSPLSPGAKWLFDASAKGVSLWSAS